MRYTPADKRALKRLMDKKESGDWDGTAETYLRWLKNNINQRRKAS